MANEKRVYEYREKLAKLTFEADKARLPQGLRELADVVRKLEMNPFLEQFRELDQQIAQAQFGVQQLQASANNPEGVDNLRAANAELADLIAQREQLAEFAAAAQPIIDQTTIDQSLQSIRDRTEALKEEAEMIRIKRELEAQGFSGDALENQLELVEINKKYTEQMEFLNAEVGGIQQGSLVRGDRH